MRAARPGIRLLAIGVTIAVLGVAWWATEDARLGAAATERALSAETGIDDRYRCRSIENDGSIQLDDVDYECWGARTETLVWVGTDVSRITGVQVGGP